MTDPVLETLFLPFEDGALEWPTSPALFLRARFGHTLREIDPTKLICEQSFKPEFDALSRAGFALRDYGDATTYPLTLVLPPRQREEYRALLARAINATQTGGIVLACVSNLEGAKTVENDLKALCGNVSSLSKHKCRAFWAVVGDDLNADLIDEWLYLDTPRPILDGRFISRPGIFAWDRLDAGSQRLLEHLPKLSGIGADLGAGFGYLTAEALTRSPDITRIDMFEAERRALDVADMNLLPFKGRVASYWQDVTKGVTGEWTGPYDFIIANPPFHTGRADRNDLGQAFIRAAASGLKTGGSFYMVANRHLPYEETLKGAFKSVIQLTETRDYKVYKGIKGAAK